MTRVSVVVPTYNHARFIGDALRSVVAQTHADWEAIVVNNFSSDDTVDVVRGIGDPRIRLVDFANHGIIAAGRNEGIRLATGEYVAFLDSDDAWHPTKLARCAAVLDAGADLVCHAERWTGGGRPEREVRYGPSAMAAYRPLLLRQNCISTSATVVRRSVLERVGAFDARREFVTAEDYELWLRISRAGCDIQFVDDVLGEYRRHEGNASGAVLRHYRAERAVVEHHLDGAPGIGFAARRRRIARCVYTAGRGFQAAGRRGAALRMFAGALARWPFEPRTWAALALLAVPGRARIGG